MNWLHLKGMQMVLNELSQEFGDDVVGGLQFWHRLFYGRFSSCCHFCRLNELRDHERQNPLNSTLLPITYSCMYILCYYIFKKIRWNKIGVDC